MRILYFPALSLSVIFIFFCIPTAYAQAATYYVSPSGNNTTGLSETDAFRTIQLASDKTLPGDTVLVMNGDYQDTWVGSTVLTINRSGTAASPITYKAYPTHKPRILIKDNWSGFRILGSYIVVDGFEFSGNSNSVTYTYAYSQKDIANPTTNGNCITIGNSTTIVPHHVTIRNNDIHHCSGSGIAANMSDYVTIEKNTVRSTSWWTRYGTSGISIFHPKDIDTSTAVKNIITGNVTYDNENYIPWSTAGSITDGHGIIVDDTKHTQDGLAAYKGKTLITNNIGYGNGGNAINVYSSSNVDVFNNSTYMNSRSPSLDGGEISSNSSSNVQIQNNIMYARTGKKATNNYNNTNVTYDYNTYFNGTVAVKGPNDIVLNPLYVNPSTSALSADFHLQALSLAIDTGSGAVAPSRDFEDVTRPIGGKYDRGAYEYRIASTGDTTAPSVPTNLVATPISTSQINLSWNASTDAVGVIGYKIFSGGIQIASVTSGTTYSNTGLTSGSSYGYSVSAYDTAGNTSPLSVSVIVKTQTLADISAPSTPTNLRATVISAFQINLSWSASTDNIGVTGYNIYRNGIAYASTTSTAYTNMGLSGATTYTYTVSAYDANKNTSAQPPSVTATTLSDLNTSAPSVPTNVVQAVGDPSTIVLSWTPSTDNVAVKEYVIERNGTQYGFIANASFTDTAVASGTSYTYRISARDTAGNQSAYSAQLIASPGKGLVVQKDARVQTITTANVMSKARSSGKGSKVQGTQQSGAAGLVTNGPQNSEGAIWWYVNFDSGADGWITENSLIATLASADEHRRGFFRSLMAGVGGALASVLSLLGSWGW